jgi:DNA-binding response OmpR family regulator
MFTARCDAVSARSKLRATPRPVSTRFDHYAPDMDQRGILVIEDDDAIASGLMRVLESHGYAARRLARGAGAVRAAGADVGLVILDLGLPDVDGLELCRRLRAARPDLAILIVTAHDNELDVVSGLDAGGDDYLVKPFRLSELLARIRAHQRRATTTTVAFAAHLQTGEVRVDRSARRAWLGAQELTLRPKEFDLLALFVANAGIALTRERIMDEVWDTAWVGSTKTLDTHVLGLRNKLGAESIATLRGVGYRFELR